LAKNGANVAVVAQTESEIESVVDEISKKEGKSISIKADVSNEEQVKKMVKIVNEKFGVIDVLINNAAVNNPRGELVSTRTEDWDRCMAVNLKGMFLCTREVIGEMMKRRSGKIINVSSRAGREGFDKFTAYCTSKYGVIGFTEALAVEMSKYGVFVNAVCPDRVVTKMALSVTPKGDYTKWLQPDDLADLFVFMASDESKSVNSATINAYGFARTVARISKGEIK